MEPTPCRGTVLVIDDNVFEAGYVTATLQARGFRVCGRDAAADVAEHESDGAPALCAAVIGHGSAGDGLPALVGELRGRGTPVMVLLPRALPHLAVAADVPVLVTPFAAYQVADWVASQVLPPQR